MQHMTKEQRAVRDADFKQREQPRVLWASMDGTAIRTNKGYRAKLPVGKVKKQLTEAEDNAIGRALRRRSNKALLGWRPYGRR